MNLSKDRGFSLADYTSSHNIEIYTLINSPTSQNSLTVVDDALVDQTVSGASPLTRYQFERCGFFCVDYDTTSDKVVFFTMVHVSETCSEFDVNLSRLCLTEQ